MDQEKINLAIFASGSGTNAENISKYFLNHENVAVTKILSNNSNALVLARGKNLGIPTQSFSRSEFKDPAFLKHLEHIDYIILAGFLWLVPSYLIDAFPDKILNIHPALLPKFGGKGMYGDHVHQAVIEANEIESGITIHLVNEAYDEGKILCQKACEVVENETAGSLATKIHSLEYEYFPKVIEDYILNWG